MVLDEVDKGDRRLAAAFHAAWFTRLRRDFALIDKAFCQRPRYPLFRLVGEILVIGAALARQQDVQHSVEVVVPLGIEATGAETLGVILSGAYEFGTGDKEIMEILGGELRALLPGAAEWQTFSEGQSFEVPANSRFSCATDSICDYCCSYVKE